jgi:hypothetical protein
VGVVHGNIRSDCMENNEILERLRGYNFFKINFKYEYEERLEKFLILASKTNKFQLENGNLLNYEIIKKLLKKKNVRMVRDIEAFRKLKLQEIVKENLTIIKWRILDDLNAIFREDNLKFSFNKNSSDEIIEEQSSNLDKTKIENHLEVLRYYYFNKVKTGLVEEYEDRLGRLLLLAKKSKSIKFIDENKEEQELNYETVVSLIEKKGLTLQMSKIKFNQNSSLSMDSYLATSETYKNRIIKDLNKIFEDENITFELIKQDEEKPVTFDKLTITERLEKYKIPIDSTGVFEIYRETLEKFLIAVAKTHLFILKKTKEELTYPIIKNLLSKKCLVMKSDKFDFSLKKLSNISQFMSDNLNSLKEDILKDLNTIFDKEDIEFSIIEKSEENIVKEIKEQNVIEEKYSNKEDNKELNKESYVDKENKLEYFVSLLKKYPFRNVRMGLNKEYADRLEKLFILSGKSKMIMVKNTKQLIDYEISLSLLKKKGLKMQSDKRTFINGNLSDSTLNRLKTQKYDIVNDLNIIYKNEEIEFCLVNEMDNSVHKTPKNEVKNQIELSDKSNMDLLQEIASLKECIDKINEELVTYKEHFSEQNNNNFTKIDIEIPNFIKNMDNYDVISVRGNKEYYEKFKRFASLHGIPICHLMNYLFYYAMEKLGRE